jgi:tetratricopeptide (TPR) repeat protein
MKRILSITLAAALTLALFTACSKIAAPVTAAEFISLGEKYLLELDYEQAVVQFLNVIEIEPKNPRGYIGAAEAYVGLEKYDEAAGTLQNGVAELPEDRDFIGDAAGIYEVIIENVPKNETYYIELSELYIILGEDEKAAEVLRIGLEACPGNSAIVEKLELLIGSEVLPDAVEIDKIIDETIDDAIVETAVVDWKSIYLNTMLEALHYAENITWENHDLENIYPANLYSFKLCDLNFDGVPELFILGDGAGAADGMKILVLTEQGTEKIFQGWSPFIELRRNKNDNSPAYGFASGNGEMSSGHSEYYITNDKTILDSTFTERAKIADASFSEEYDYDSYSWEETLISAEYIFNGQNVSGEEYETLSRNVFSEYETVPYTSATLECIASEYQSASVTEADFIAFLDSYVPEITLFE